MTTPTTTEPRRREPVAPGLIAYPTTLDDLRGRVTIDVFHRERPSYAGLVGIGRCRAYADAQAGVVQTVSAGRRRLVLVAPLLRSLGVTLDDGTGRPNPDGFVR